MNDAEFDKLKKSAKEESPKVVEYFYAEVERLEGYADRNWKAIKNFSRKAMILLIVLITILLVLGILSVNLSGETNNLTMENHDRIKEIANSRKISILDQCNEQNQQHNDAKHGIEELVKKSVNEKSFTAIEIKKQKILVNLFVEAIVPQYNCTKRVARFTK